MDSGLLFDEDEEGMCGICGIRKLNSEGFCDHCEDDDEDEDEFFEDEHF